MRTWLSIALFVSLVLTGCSIDTQLQPPPTPQPTEIPTWTPPGDSSMVEVRTIVVKLVRFPSHREQDFAVLHLDGTYSVHFSEYQCLLDNPSYMYGPFDSVKHCPILEPDISGRLIDDQAWLDDDLAPFRQYLSCINGWVYLGKQNEQETWFIEMFGFPAFC